VTQSIEIYKGKPIFYSLGNFLFPGFTEKECNTGWALQLSVNKNAIDWKIYEISINSNGIPSLSGKEISMTEVREYKL
jgi:poly-gamma-glutamate synthesis protein (capsule biosynthesis protein)